MKTISNAHHSDLDITEHTLIIGQVIGQVTIRSTVEVILKGLIIGDVIVEEGAHFNLHGTVIGDVRNQMGIIKVTGILNGNIAGEGECNISHTAKLIKSTFIVPYYKEFKIKKLTQPGVALPDAQ